jgi:hypothetical protein
MSLYIQNNNGSIYSGCTITIHNGQTTVQTPAQEASQPEDITAEPAAEGCCLFTKKTIREKKETEITLSLQRSMASRTDKARALVEEVRQCQKDGYIDANYNARVMYDELNKIITLPFQYDGFRKYYNE